MDDFQCLNRNRLCPKCGITEPKDRRSAQCRKCAASDPRRTDKIKQTKLERYGNSNYRNSEKIEQTCIERYGVSNISKTAQFKDQYKRTMNEKYGVDNYFQLSDKVKESWNKSFGADNPQRNKRIKNKTLGTMKSKYGEMQGAIPKSLIEKACLSGYGTKQFFSSECGRMTAENLQKNYGWTDERLEILWRQKLSGSVGFGKASKESLKVFIPLYKLLRRRYEINKGDVLFGISGTNELRLYDTAGKFGYSYDFSIPKIKLVIEYNGIKFHPKSSTDKNWAPTFAKQREAIHQYETDQKKLDMAKSLGYKVLVLWSDDSIETNLDKSKKFIEKECITNAN